ncbi:MAG TPA: ABC transporter family substrate-binding protein [Streptosporangiaceae bacterium]|nr:ABC transporter family substrate-binding protein [Streptosporangiaceae bacterium]
MTGRAGRLAVAVLLPFAAAAGGCAPSQPEPPGSHGSPAAGAILPASDINPVPRERIRDGGTLRRAIDALPGQWNYHHVRGGTASLDLILRGLLPYPFRTDERGAPYPDRDYVISAAVTATRPRQVVTYMLNPKARWSTGLPITYRDYAAQAAALSGRDPRFKIGSAGGYGLIAKVARGVDDFHVVITFARPYAGWAALFSPLYPAATNAGPRTFNDGWADRVIATGGPFRLGGIDLTAKSVTIVRDDRWWGRRAKLDAMVFRVLDHAAAPGALAGGELDLADIGADPVAYRRLRAAPGVVVRKAAGPDWRQFTFNAAGPVLSDVRVRRALALGIDRRTIAAADLHDLGWPVRTLDNHFFMNTQAGYADNSGGLGRYDPVRAGRLLDTAGWRRHGPLRRRAGRILTVRFVIPAATPVSRREAVLTQAMLGKIGVRVDIQTMPAGGTFFHGVHAGNFDITPFSWLGSTLPVASARSIFVKPRPGGIQQNYSRVGSDRIDHAMDAALGEPDPVRVRRQVNAADRLIWQIMGVLPLYQRPQLVGVTDTLAGEGARGFRTPAYEDMGFTAR